MPKSLTPRLAQMKEEIEGYARGFGLDFFETVFEMLGYDELNMVASYGGFPNRYPHWRWGMEYEQLSKGYEYGLSKIYELVINNEPCYAYLLESNAEVDQKLVMAHVYGHCDFFKNNFYFQHTNRRMMDEMANHATRVRRWVDKVGIEKVEDFIDRALSLENLIDYHSPYIRRSPDPKRAEQEEKSNERVEGFRVDREYMRGYVNPLEFLESQRKKVEDEKAKKKHADGFVCLGTSGFVGITSSKRVNGKRGIVSIQSADPNKLLLIAETETAGACVKWAAKELYCADADSATFQRMDQDVAGTAPGAGGLIFTPWMYGERCPVADESLRAAFINLGSNHTRTQMARAIYEGVAYNVRWILENIAELYGFKPDPLRVIGGGARGLPWLQIVADVTGRTLESVPDPQEASAVGAALIAAVGLGLYPNIESVKSLVPAGHVVKPDPAPRATYDELYAAYRQVYRSLRGLYHTLNRSH